MDNIITIQRLDQQAILDLFKIFSVRDPWNFRKKKLYSDFQEFYLIKSL